MAPSSADPSRSEQITQIQADLSRSKQNHTDPSRSKQNHADPSRFCLGFSWICLDLLKSSLRELFFEQKVPLGNFFLSKKFPKKDEWVP